jgi:3-oxoadipyl-CoA thiolase
MREAFICDAIRTPIGRYGGSLSQVRTDDLAAIPIKALLERNPGLDREAIDDVIMGCANQAGEDNRNIARMALLLAGLPDAVPGLTVNRLCGSGMQAVADAARLIKSGEASLVLAGGAESMSRAPFVVGKSFGPFARNIEFHDTTIGWRFVNPVMKALYGVDAMAQTAQNVADEQGISRQDQDTMALASQEKASKAIAAGLLAEEITSVAIPQHKGESVIVDRDEHPRGTSLEALAKLKSITGPNGSITAGNSSGINDGACVLIVADEAGVKRHGLTPKARVVGAAVAGVPPRIMGMGPVSATKKLLQRLSIGIADIDIIELNEAFAAQGLAVLRALGLKDDDPRVNPLGGAIALGHPLGMSGARLVCTAAGQLRRTGKKLALCTMCIGVGQGISMIIERI